MYKRRVKVRNIIPGSGGSTSSSFSSVSPSKSVDNKENDEANSNNVDDEIAKPSSPNMFDDVDEQPVKKLKTTDTLAEEENINKVISQKSQPLSSFPKSKGNDRNKQENSSKHGYNYFREVTRFSGMKVHMEAKPNELEKDQAVFVQNVSLFLKKDENSLKKNADLFLEELKSYCNDSDHFKNALLPTKVYLCVLCCWIPIMSKQITEDDYETDSSIVVQPSPVPVAAHQGSNRILTSLILGTLAAANPSLTNTLLLTNPYLAAYFVPQLPSFRYPIYGYSAVTPFQDSSAFGSGYKRELRQ